LKELKGLSLVEEVEGVEEVEVVEEVEGFKVFSLRLGSHQNSKAWG
jgi:hypothetical protein